MGFDMNAPRPGQSSVMDDYRVQEPKLADPDATPEWVIDGRTLLGPWLMAGERVRVVPASHLEGAVDALRKYGAHLPECPVAALPGDVANVECACGFHDAIRGR